jgi:hypothetical protein
MLLISHSLCLIQVNRQKKNYIIRARIHLFRTLIQYISCVTICFISTAIYIYIFFFNFSEYNIFLPFQKFFPCLYLYKYMQDKTIEYNAI